MIDELLPSFTHLVIEEGRPADALLNSHLRDHRELGSRDRRFLSQALFSYWRWYGWTVRKLGLNTAESCLIGAALDSASVVLGEARQVLSTVDEVVGTTSPELQAILASLDSATQSLNYFVTRISERPLRLLTGVGVPPDTIR